MDELPDWLPQLEPLENYGGDWRAYCECLYQIFLTDFVTSKPDFRGERLGLKKHPIIDGKEATFWHLISEGDIEADRTPDLRRCERIRWPRAILDHNNDSSLKIWTEKRGSDHRIHIWLEADGYLVVLNRRNGYLLPWTAFYVERERQREKYLKRWKRNREK